MLKIILLSVYSLFIAGAVNCQNVKTTEVKTNSDSPTAEADEKVFAKVEKEAEFAGGQTGWITYLENNLKADVPIKKGAPVGTYMVIVRFIVSKNGSIKNIEAETSYGFGMEKEVIRIIKKGPKWTPALQNGRPVNAYRRQPVTFIVSEE